MSSHTNTHIAALQVALRQAALKQTAWVVGSLMYLFVTCLSIPAYAVPISTAQPITPVQPSLVAQAKAVQSEVVDSDIASPATTQATFVVGKNYSELPIQDKIDGDDIIVREFFWYGCIHCYNFEPQVQLWLRSKPSDVRFVRTPAPLNPIWEANARGYYAAQALGIADISHTALLHAIHQKNQKIFSQDSLATFYSGFGANLSDFTRHYNSTQTQSKITQDRDAIIRYRLKGVPALVINGQYVVTASAQSFAIVDYLVDRIRIERAQQAQQ